MTNTLFTTGHSDTLTVGDRRYAVILDGQDIATHNMLDAFGEIRRAEQVTVPMNWDIDGHTINFHMAVDKAYQLNMRLCLFVGEVWANQIIASMQHHAQTGRMSYMELMRQAVDTAAWLYSKGRT